MNNYNFFDRKYLISFSTNVFKYFKVPEKDAVLASQILDYSDIRGIDSHGVARLHSYFDMLKLGRINPKPIIKIIREKKSIATVDGDNGLGLVVGPKAHQIAMNKAKNYGSGFISVSNTNHFGSAGYYSERSLKNDQISWSMTNSTKLVAPIRGKERMLGTNPIAIAFPGYKEPPIVIDLATSAAAYGKIEIANRKNTKIPKGWSINKSGDNTTNPMDMIEDGSLLPIGSFEEIGGHKGYCLASMVDILCCVLSKANWGPFAPPFALQQEIPKTKVGKGIGHFFGAMEIDGFIDVEEFKKEIDQWIKVFRNTKPINTNKKVLIPGDPERSSMKFRLIKGIPLINPVIKDLYNISEKTGIEPPAGIEPAT